MKRDQLEADVIVGVVTSDVDQSGITGLSRCEAKRQLIMRRIHSFPLIHRVSQYSSSMPAVFQAGDVTAELVRYTVYTQRVSR